MEQETATDGPARPDYARRSHELEKARTPFHLPIRAWWRIGRRTFDRIGDNALTVIAAGCAFFTLLALFPALSAMATLYGLAADPQDVARQLSNFHGVVPDQVLALLTEQAQRLSTTTNRTLGWGLAISLVLSLWGATRTVRSLLSALNVIYDEKEQRGLILLNVKIFGITVSGLIVFTILQFFIAALPTILRHTWLGEGTSLFIAIMRWPAIGLILAALLTLLFRFAPSRADAQWLWVMPGAFFASVGWIAASVAFSLYVSFFENYSNIYGSFGAIIILLLWMYWSFLIILLGAVLNAELEHEVARDTTTGRPHPLGQREAEMADRVAGGHG